PHGRPSTSRSPTPRPRWTVCANSRGRPGACEGMAGSMRSGFARGPTLHLAPLRSKLGLSGGRDPCSTLVLVQGTGQLSEIVLLSPRGFVANDIEPSLGSADCHVHEVDRLRGPVSCPRPIRIAAQNEEDNWCFSALR